MSHQKCINLKICIYKEQNIKKTLNECLGLDFGDCWGQRYDGLKIFKVWPKDL